MKTPSNTLLLSLILFFFMINLLFAGTQEVTKKSVLLVYGGWDGHEPEEFKDLFEPWLIEQDFEVVVSNSLDIYADEDKMANFDLIIQSWTMGEISKEQEAGLIKAVKNGAGLAGCHGGIGDSFRSNTNFLFMVGGQFVAHPGGQIDFKVNIENHDDPITKGLSDFTVHSEQYYMLVDPAIEVLASTTFSGEHVKWVEGVKMPVVWKKKYGEGKIFYSSIGHSISDFDVPEVMEIMKRGILWAMRNK
jgi:type 1 glutamine amidotransferase